MAERKKQVSIPKLEEKVRGGKRYLRKDEGPIFYSLGRHTFEKLVKESKAVVRYGNSVLIDTERINSYLEAFYDDAD